MRWGAETGPLIDPADPRTEWKREWDLGWSHGYEQWVQTDDHVLVVVVRPLPRPCDWIVQHKWSEACTRGTAPTVEVARWIALAVARSRHAPFGRRAPDAADHSVDDVT